MTAKKGLGRGLDALFADEASIINQVKGDTNTKAETGPASDDLDENKIYYIDLNEIKPNEDQPRIKFDESKLQELADSIKTNGVIQPLIVRKESSGYSLVAGERRWRAARLAGLNSVPCIIRDFDDKQNAIVAIIENMQREDLDAIEEAKGIQAMTEKYGFTQEEVAVSLGKSRAYVTNSMRLLKLPGEIQNMVIEGQISPAHARTIINIENSDKQMQLAQRIVSQGLSVRDTEKLANQAKSSFVPKTSKPLQHEGISPELKDAIETIRNALGTKVSLSGNEKSGKIEIEYYSFDELNRIVEYFQEN